MFIDINTSIDSTVHHLLSIIQASLKAACLCATRVSPTSECVNSDIFESAIEFSKRTFMNQPRAMLWSNTVSSPASLRAVIDFKESRKAYISSLRE